MRGGIVINSQGRSGRNAVAITVTVALAVPWVAWHRDPVRAGGQPLPHTKPGLSGVDLCASSVTTLVALGEACARDPRPKARLPLSGPLSTWPVIHSRPTDGAAEVGADTAAQSETDAALSWKQLPRAVPKRRQLPQLAYDSNRDRTLLFGGFICPDNRCFAVNDTWTFDGSTWTELHPETSPPALLSSGMAYDAVHDEMVLFGGTRCDGVCVATNETWTFDGTEWHKEQPAASPPPRYAHAMAYDAKGQRVLMFGGCIVNCPADANDTWAWDGTTWTRLNILPSAAPPPRDSAALVYDSTHEELVLFGGQWLASAGGSVPRGDTWTLTGTTWTQKATTGPPARWGPVAADAPMSGGIVLGGGTSNGFALLNDTWTWDGSAWTIANPTTAMPGVANGDAVYDATDRRVFIVGGTYEELFVRGSLRDVWAFDGVTWDRLPTPWPQERTLSYWGNMLYDPNSRTTMIISGLCIFDRDNCKEVWSWDGQRWTWMSGPEVPRGGMATYDYATGLVTVVLGGFLSTWDGQQWTRIQTDTFPRAWQNGVASDAAGHLVAYSGPPPTGQDEYSKVTSIWDGRTWTNVELDPTPRGRQGGAIAYDPSRGQTVLFGGLECRDDEPLQDRLLNPACPLSNETWVWDGTAWEQKHPANVPTARWVNSLTYDPVNKHLVLYGGMNVQNQALNDAWAWDGEDWNRLEFSTPPPTYQQHGMAVGRDGRLLMFGGQAQWIGRMSSELYAFGEPAPFELPPPSGSPPPPPSPSPSASPSLIPASRGVYPAEPDDAFFADQWGPTTIEAPASWQLPRATGFGITVAVVDSGVDLQHEDLRCPGKLEVVSGSDFAAKDNNPDDELGHGTHVAGIIGACTHNDKGVAGVAPDSTILPVRVLAANGSGSFEDVAAGIRFAADQGAHVINLSLSGGPESALPLFDLSVVDAAVDYAVAQGAVVVAAAGNRSFPLCESPALARDVICVGATDRRDLKAWYSGFANKSNPGAELVAPGGTESVLFCDIPAEQILSLWTPENDPCFEGRPGYYDTTGTSMAAPHVAGAAALVYDRLGGERSPTNAQTVINTLVATADDLGPPGHDPVFGSGRVNALDAVTAIEEPGPTKTSRFSFTNDSAPTGQFSDPTIFQARLVDDETGAPLAQREVTFTLGTDGGREFTDRTNADGVATVTPKLVEQPGSHQLTARFGGDDDYKGSADTRVFLVETEDTTTELVVAGRGSKRSLRARLTDRDSSDPIADRSILFFSDDRQIGSDDTGLDGWATTELEPRDRGGHHTYEAHFEGDAYYRSSHAEQQT